MTYKDLSNLIFPNITKTIEDYELMYPERNLKEGACVSRFAPSPTGFVHMGSLMTAFTAKKIATDTDGVFYLRIEDTDQKRQAENGIEGILEDFHNFDFDIEEGIVYPNETKGNYGPYIQSERKEIYQTFIKHLIENEKAYPCFCSQEHLNYIRENQEQKKERIGYYGKYATCRNISLEEQIEKIKNGESYIIRLKSPGNFEKKFLVKDAVKGDIAFPQNDLDIVILKSDNLPTYHFAHLVDDHLMRTTHVIRGDEWVSSLPIHIQLFEMFGYKPPIYLHLSPLMKQDGDSRRKLSKRKDPEAAVSYYHEKGIPVYAVYLYLMTIANSNFEMWLDQNHDKKISDFKFDPKKVSSSGGLFDLEKLYNISKNYISKMTKEEVYKNALNWSKKYNKELENILTKYKEYSTYIFNIEREQKKPRKDYASYSDILEQIWYMYDELFDNKKLNYEFQNISDLEEIKIIIKTYIDKYYKSLDDKEAWFNKIKELCNELGYASDMKAYKEKPDNYKGNVADISTVIRVALTTKSNTPDLYEISKLIGKERIEKRFSKFY